jgi:histidinol-phosphate aminotransferase
MLTVRTFSKVYGLAGLRVGYGVAPQEIIALMHRVRQPFNVNSAAQWAAVAALDDCEHVQRSLALNTAGLRYLAGEFKKLGLEYVPSCGNFILVHVGDGQRIFTELLKKFPEHVRVTVGTEEENRKFINALSQVIRSS